MQTTQRPPRRHQRRRPQINAVRDRLIRRGLAPRPAVRYARELQAHWEDLRDERLACGAAPRTAEAEADRRLGAAPDLARAAVDAHRRETFSGRHPVLSFAFLPFALVPLSPVVMILAVLPLSLLFGTAADDDADATTPADVRPVADPRDAMPAVIVLLNGWTYALPAALTVLVYRRARRRMLSAGWAWAACASVALGAGLQNVNLVWRGRADRPAMLSFGFGNSLDLSLVVATLAVGALAWWLGRPAPGARIPVRD